MKFPKILIVIYILTIKLIPAPDYNLFNIHDGGDISGEIQVNSNITTELHLIDFRPCFSRAFLHPFSVSISWVQLVLFTICLSISVNLTKLLEFEVTQRRYQ